MERYAELNWGQRSRSNLLVVAGAFTNSGDALVKLSNSPIFKTANFDLHAVLVRRPSGQKPLQYDDEYITQILGSTWQYIVDNRTLAISAARRAEPDLSGLKISAWNGDTVEVQLKYKFICLYYRRSYNSKTLLDRFFPMFHAVSFGSEHSRDELLLSLQDTPTRLKEIIGLFSKQLTTGAHRATPLLLPYFNFQHDHKMDLFRSITESPFAHDAISKGIQAARKSLRKKRTDIFFDERNIPFEPGESHGSNVIRNGSEKEINSTLNGCFRFGAPYPAQFHYNVTNTKNTQIAIVDYLDGESILRQGRYVNITPNDRLR